MGKVFELMAHSKVYSEYFTNFQYRQRDINIMKNGPLLVRAKLCKVGITNNLISYENK